MACVLFLCPKIRLGDRCLLVHSDRKANQGGGCHSTDSSTPDRDIQKGLSNQGWGWEQSDPPPQHPVGIAICVRHECRVPVNGGHPALLS